MSWADAIAQLNAAVLSPAGPGAATVIYTPAGGAPSPAFPGMFDRNQVSASQGRLGVERVYPSLFVRLSDLPEDVTATDAAGRPLVNPRINVTDPITGISADYELEEVNLDSMGAAILYLREAMP